MKKTIYILSLLLFLSGSWEHTYAKKKKKEDKKETTSPYQKLLGSKKGITVDGWMKMHIVDGKLYAEFPLSQLGKDMALTSSIERISDNGEGVVGQFAGRLNHFCFTRLDSMLQARLILRSKVVNSGMGANPDEVIASSNAPGVFQNYPILAYSPDSTAIVVDLTELFLESSRFTNPFSSYAGNSLFGFVQRTHKFEPERSTLLAIRGGDNQAIVTCDLGFNVDRTVFGTFVQAQDVPVSVTVNKILMPLPEEHMRPRLADSRVGVSPSMQIELPGIHESMKPYYIVRRWRLEAADEARYLRGEIVNVKKPLVFYVDTLMPATWIKYIKAGFEAWNPAFEKIGFKNVIQVKEFPRDPSFDANNIKNSTIRYAPLWMYYPQHSMHCDPRTGEILNASVYMHANVASLFYTTRTEETMAADPSVRKSRLSDEQLGEMIKAKVMQVAGRCLGLTDNYAASSVYPVDSLRSASFTRKYGVVASVMDDFTCNRVAQPGDVEKGVVMVQQNIGPYDYEAIKYLYKPVVGVENFKDEKTTLDQWIREMQTDPYCRYVRPLDSWATFDPRSARGDLGDDQIKATRYMLENLKVAIRNFFEWYKDNDEDLEARRLCYSELTGSFMSIIRPLTTHLGGIELYDIPGTEKLPSYKPVPKKKQQEILSYLLALSKELAWLDNSEVMRQLQITDSPSAKMAESIFAEIMSRLRYVGIAAQKSGGEYTQEEYIQDIYDDIWAKTIKGQPLSKSDMDFEQIFLASIIATSSVDAAPSQFGPVMEEGLRSLTPVEQKLFDRLQQYPIREAMTGERTVEAGETSGFAPIPYFEATNGSIAHIYMDMLFKTRDLIQQALARSSGETKLHYEFMLFRIKKALEKE